MAFGPNGNLFVASELGNAVLEYNGTTGAFVGEFVAAGSGGLSEPTFIGVGGFAEERPVWLPRDVLERKVRGTRTDCDQGSRCQRHEPGVSQPVRQRTFDAV